MAIKNQKKYQAEDLPPEMLAIWNEVVDEVGGAFPPQGGSGHGKRKRILCGPKPLRGRC